MIGEPPCVTRSGRPASPEVAAQQRPVLRGVALGLGGAGTADSSAHFPGGALQTHLTRPMASVRVGHCTTPSRSTRFSRKEESEPPDGALAGSPACAPRSRWPRPRPPGPLTGCCSPRRYCDCFASGDFCNNCNCNNCCNNLRHEIERFKAIKVTFPSVT